MNKASIGNADPPIPRRGFLQQGLETVQDQLAQANAERHATDARLQRTMEAYESRMREIKVGAIANG